MITRIKNLFLNIFGGIIVAGIVMYLYILNLVSAIVAKFRKPKTMIKVEIE